MAEDIRGLIEVMGGKVESVSGPLPDGSGFAVASFPLPADHWLLADHENVPPTPWQGVGSQERQVLIHSIRAAAKYAIRAATANGKEMDFDPDALLQNLDIGLFGYSNDPAGIKEAR